MLLTLLHKTVNNYASNKHIFSIRFKATNFWKIKVLMFNWFNNSWSQKFESSVRHTQCGFGISPYSSYDSTYLHNKIQSHKEADKKVLRISIQVNSSTPFSRGFLMSQENCSKVFRPCSRYLMSSTIYYLFPKIVDFLLATCDNNKQKNWCSLRVKQFDFLYCTVFQTTNCVEILSFAKLMVIN